jgi:hypothetical protein
MTRKGRIKELCLFLTVAATIAATGAARGGEFAFDSPSDDRWHYPFNPNAGRRATASCFGSTSDPNYTTFNDRDGIFVVAWRTNIKIPTGLPPKSYDIRTVRVTLTNLGANSSSPSGATWPVDLTPDEWFTMDYPINDADPGQPIELFGAGFGPDYTYVNWVETSPYVGSNDEEFVPRDPFPFMFDGSTSTMQHIEDNVKDHFTPVPWAIGTPVGYTPENQPAPFPVIFDINLNLSSGKVLSYFQEQLGGGRVFVVATSLRETYQEAPAGFPTFFTKEGAALDPNGKAPQLTIVAFPTGDVNGDGRRGLVDAASLSNCMAGPDSLPFPVGNLNTAQCLFLFDIDEDGDVDLADAAAFAQRRN